jgi:HSP20 family protein
MVDNKKKKPSEDEDNPFGDDFFKILNDQMRRIFENQFPGVIPPNFDANNKVFQKMFYEILKKMNLDPEMIKNMDPKELQDMLKNNPYVFGMNMRISPDGKPYMDSFGSTHQKNKDSEEFQNERDPMVDIYEEEGKIVVVCEVPGVTKSQIELKASPNELEILAEASEKGYRQRKYHKIIALPAEINPDIAKARYMNGILEVKLEKIEKKPSKKKIDIE